MGVTSDTAPDAELRPLVERAWASLVSQADAIADDITLTLIAIQPEWHQNADPSVRADLRSSTREHVRRGIRAMAGLTPGANPVDLWRDTGRRRARQGVPLEYCLNAYTVGTRMLWEAMVHQQEALGIDDRVMVLAGRQVWTDLDVQNSVMSSAYRKEAALLQRRDLQLQGRLLDGLAEGRGGDPAFAAEVQDILGVAADAQMACVVAAFDGNRDSPLRNPDDRLEKAGLMSFWHVRGDHHFGLVPLGSRPVAEAVADLVEQLACCNSGRVGIATADDLGGFGTAFQLATHTVETVPRGRTDIAVVDDRLPQVLLTASPAVSHLLVRRTLGPIQAQPTHQSDVLLATLRALIAHGGSPTHAAEDLICHRNTVIYRIKQIQDLTGKSISDPRDRLLFALALMALEK